MPAESRRAAVLRRDAVARAAQYIEVQLRHLDLHRDGRHILRDFSWHLRPGERWVVVGANGAGKTQLLKLLAGAVWPDPSRLPTRRYRWRGRWQGAPQDLVEQVAYLGPERQDRYERYGWDFAALAVVGTGFTRSDIPQGPLSPLQRRRALALLGRFDAQSLARRRFLSLSHGERRLVLLARALAGAPRLLLLDELFAGLDEQHRQRVMRWLESTARSSLPWVLSSHRLEETPLAATHQLRIEFGRIVECGPLQRPRRGPRVSVPASGAAAPITTATRRGASRYADPDAAEPLVRLHAVSVYLDYRRVLQNLSLTVLPGQCWLVQGPNGSGKTTLLRAIHGDYPPALGGRIERRGVEPGVPIAEFRRICSMVAPWLQAEYPREERVLDVVVSGLHSSFGLESAPTAAERVAALDALRAQRLVSSAGRTLALLSYGQARRVMFARAAIQSPQLLLLDEPFAGIDSATRRVLRHGIEMQVERGAAVVLSSHHRDEWPVNCSHELELRAGRAVYCGPVRGRLDR